MNPTTNQKGQLAVSKAELRALELGYIPSRPLYNCRYDLVIDKNNLLQRIQVKYADGKSNNSNGNVVVKLEYIDRHNKVDTYHEDEVDALIVYIPKLNKLCYFPKNVFISKRKLNIRINKAKKQPN